ncbi:MAG: HD domain-containing protein [Treponema sp.]|jgi:HD superfamily phosphohydrolase|nr:HD domain-containing protein [Treponema sp.]
MRHDLYAALCEGYNDPVRDMLWGHIYLSEGLAALERAPAFFRLHRILQLGPVHCVYPGATHTRAAHSLGVYHLCRRLLLRFAEEGAPWLSGEGARSFLCAGLLHDLGHFPYAHSLKELPLASHEALTARAIRAEPLRSLVGRAGADPDLAAAIVDEAAGAAAAAGGSDTECGFYRRLLSGALDPDKLDYLNRDALCCGVPYGAQDVDFILSRLYPHEARGADIDSRGIPSVEALLFSKYLMYRNVYWHRSVRAATAMVKKALVECLARGAISPDELYGLDDQGLFALLAARGGDSAALAGLARDGALYAAAAEFPYEEAAHGALLPVMGQGAGRSAFEEALAGRLSAETAAPIGPGDVIIDIPEPFSFETGLFVRDEHRAFTESSTAFKGTVIDGFERSLRIVRVFVNPLYAEKVRRAGIRNLLDAVTASSSSA